MNSCEIATLNKLSEDKIAPVKSATQSSKKQSFWPFNAKFYFISFLQVPYLTAFVKTIKSFLAAL